MDATQLIRDSILESDEGENEEENDNEREQPLAKLCILQNKHIPAAELPLFLGDNVLGRDPGTCSLPFPATSVSKQHATICISVHRRRGRHSQVDVEALVWDLGSLNGTRKGRLKLTPNVRYALGEGDSLVVADIPCQYVSCAVKAESSPGDARTPVSQNSRVKVGAPDASSEKAADTSAGGERCVNGGVTPAAPGPPFDRGDTGKTPARTTCLSLEETPNQPQGTLVPESDSDSDEERRLQGDGRCKPLVLDSSRSTPNSSTFLSPTSKIVPESEDESPITASSFTKNRPYRHSSFSEEEPDVDAGRQQPRKTEALVMMDDSEEEDGAEGERATPAGTAEACGQDVSAKQESRVGPGRRPGPAEFHMDSDTDVEGEEASEAPLTSNKPQTNTDQFHMDSDTDVDEDEDMFAEAPEPVALSDDITKPPHAVPVVQPEDVMDSDTDVEDGAEVPDAALEAEPPESPVSSHTAVSAASKQPVDFHLDSDTDVEEEGEHERGANNTCSKIDTGEEVEPTGSDPAPTAAPQSLHLASDTDDEATPDAAATDPGQGSGVTHSDGSDTDVEEDPPLFLPVTVTALPVTSAAACSDSDADTDVDEPSVPPVRDGPDVESKEADLGGAGEDLRRGIISGLPVPLPQNCSTPVRYSEGEMAEMETQAFLSPSLPASRRAAAPAAALSSSQEDDNFVVPETQPFTPRTHFNHDMEPTQPFTHQPSGGGGSFRLQGPDPALSTENTQAFVSVDDAGGRATAEDDDNNMEATQAYGGGEEPATSPATYEKKAQVDLALEPTQAYISEPDSDEDMEEDEGQKLTTAETQPVMGETQPVSALGDEESLPTGGRVSPVTDAGEAAPPVETPPARAASAAQTQPMSASEDEDWVPLLRKRKAKLLFTSCESSAVDTQPLHAAADQTQPMAASGNEETDGEDSIPFARIRKAKQRRTLVNPELVAATQPMDVSDDDDDEEEESDAEDARRRKANHLRDEEEEKQKLLASKLSVAATQPVDMSDNDGSDGEDSAPFAQKRKAKQLCTLVKPELVAATQLMDVSDEEESDAEDALPFARKRKANQLRPEEEEKQELVDSELSVSATQPVDVPDNAGSDDEDSAPGLWKKRKAKPLRPEDEQTQPLADSVDPSDEAEAAVEDEEEDDDESIIGVRTRKPRPLPESTQSLTNSEASTVESQPIVLGTNDPPTGEGGGSGPGTSGTRSTRGTRARLRQEEKQVESSEPHRRQTRGNKGFTTSRGRRIKPRSDSSEEEEEEEEQEKRKIDEQVRIDAEKKEEEEAERQQREEQERKDKEEQERAEEAEKERKERERREQEAKERADRIQREKEQQMERERKEKQEQRERLEKEEKERKEQEEKERLDMAKREAEERERLEKEEEKQATKARGRRSTRRTTADPGTSEQDADIPAMRTRSRSNSSNSVSSERSTSSASTRGGRGRGRGGGAKRASDAAPPGGNRRRTVAAPPTSQQDADAEDSTAQNRGRGGRQRGRGRRTEPQPMMDQNPAPRGRPSRRGGATPGEVPPDGETETAYSRLPAATRGQRRAGNAEPAAAGLQEGGGGGAIGLRGAESKDKRQGRGKKSEGNAHGTQTVGEAASDGTPGALGNAEEVRGQPPHVQKKEDVVQEETDNSIIQGANIKSEPPQTPTSRSSRKRQAPAASSPLAKTPRSSSSSSSSPRVHAARQVYKVLFTGLEDEALERVLTRLRGSMAKGVADMNVLVTDKVRRTVKFLCAVAKGVPIVTTHWLEKSGKAGSFLSPDAFIVKDPEQETKFSFCLQESLRAAGVQPLLQGYEIHVTKSVKPDPVYMKDIISCSGATFLPKMPSSHKPQTVVVSCEEDLRLCGPAVSASLPVVSAEFILTGILQQKVDVQAHRLPAPAASPQPAGGRGRGRRRP